MIKQLLQGQSNKQHILREVFNLIRTYGPVTKSYLIKTLQLKPTTLTRIINELMENRLIRESGFGQSEGGRPPILYSVVPDAGYIISIHIIRAQTRVVLLDLLSNRIKQTSFVMTTEHTPEIVIPKIVEIIKNFLFELQIEFDKVLGIGIGTVGPVNKKDGVIQPSNFFSPGWKNVKIVNKLEREFPVHILLENAANTALIGEFKRASFPFNNVLYIINSWGLGCGVMTNGELNSKIGETSGFGHLIIDQEGPLCTCGRKGCLHTHTSLFSILQRVREQYPTLDYLDWKSMPTKNIVEQLKMNYGKTSNVIMDSAKKLGIGIANMINLFGSESVFISSPLVFHYPNYYETVVKATSDLLIQKNNVVFSQGTFDEEAQDIGIDSLVYSQFLTNFKKK